MRLCRSIELNNTDDAVLLGSDPDFIDKNREFVRNGLAVEHAINFMKIDIARSLI